MLWTNARQTLQSRCTDIWICRAVWQHGLNPSMSRRRSVTEQQSITLPLR